MPSARSTPRPPVQVDWPGSGESTAATPRWSTRGLAALVREVLAARVPPGERVTVLGHSLGAMVRRAETDWPCVRGAPCS